MYIDILICDKNIQNYTYISIPLYPFLTVDFWKKFPYFTRECDASQIYSPSLNLIGLLYTSYDPEIYENLELRAETLFPITSILNGSSVEREKLHAAILRIVNRWDGRSQIIPDDSISADTREQHDGVSSRSGQREERIQPHDEKLPFAFPLQARCHAPLAYPSTCPSEARERRGEKRREREFPPPCTLHNFTNRAYNRSAVAPVLQKRADAGVSCTASDPASRY